MHGVPGVEVLAVHGWAAYALAHALRLITVYAPNDSGGKQVARRLTCHHADAQAHERAMPRVEDARKSIIVCRASCSAGFSCCSTRIGSQASSRSEEHTS